MKWLLLEENSSNTSNMALNNSNDYLEDTYKFVRCYSTSYVVSLTDAVNIVIQCLALFLDLKY